MPTKILHIGFGFALFCIGYLLINQQILVQSILYRLAANDYHSALMAFLAMALQATVLLIGLLVLPRRLFWLLLIVVGISAAINVAFAQILRDTIDLAKFNWLVAETRHATNAAGKFLFPAAVGLGKTLVAIGLFVASRKVLKTALYQQLPPFRTGPAVVCAIFLVILPSLAFGFDVPGAIAAERNIYNYTYEKLTIPPPPQRRPVYMSDPDRQKSIDKIVWIIDESVGYDVFAKNILPKVTTFTPVDFGKAAAMANCSAPAHVALRSGVDVVNVAADTDLRRTPSIWGYAKKAGYETTLIDGQVSGPPQNLLLPPEASKIDEIQSAAAGIGTDLAIAKQINARLKTEGREFVYAVLRGVHFQYSDHYPEGFIPENQPLEEQYEAAISYSKQGFFPTLLSGVDRENVAIVYTSDHGQNVKQGVTPHCSAHPEKEEFAVPLLVFLPPNLAERYVVEDENRYSASQIFPSTLTWMGYDRSQATEKYDNTLKRQTKKFIWFGRGVTPLRPGDRIAVRRSEETLVD
ncbi:sulfatase-like hydrolase/transferase [Parasphingorhabdus sp.]|uniref:sulfatase-like hydrolase/transferase n=1 Tax=Parasphingorhabdus sp. TaxID=2709688 RepID=UPI003A93CD98